MEYLRAQKKIYKRTVDDLKIHHLDGQDPFMAQLDNFVKSAVTTHTKKE